MLTFKEWLQQFDKSLCVCGRHAEDGYAHYLTKQLGRTPTVAEVKRIGQIERLTTGGFKDDPKTQTDCMNLSKRQPATTVVLQL